MAMLVITRWYVKTLDDENPMENPQFLDAPTAMNQQSSGGSPLRQRNPKDSRRVTSCYIHRFHSWWTVHPHVSSFFSWLKSPLVTLKCSWLRSPCPALVLLHSIRWREGDVQGESGLHPLWQQGVASELGFINKNLDLSTEKSSNEE